MSTMIMTTAPCSYAAAAALDHNRAAGKEHWIDRETGEFLACATSINAKKVEKCSSPARARGDREKPERPESQNCRIGCMSMICSLRMRAVRARRSCLLAHVCEVFDRREVMADLPDEVGEEEAEAMAPAIHIHGRTNSRR